MVCNPFSDVGRTSEYTLPCGVTPPMTDRWSRVCHSSTIGVSPSRGIGLDHPRQQVEARFVHENKAPALAAGLLLQRGHDSTRHRSMASSSRWIARVIGTCGVHPRRLSRRDTWLLLYETPNSSEMTPATRSQVQTSPRKP